MEAPVRQIPQFADEAESRTFAKDTNRRTAIRYGEESVFCSTAL